MLATKNSVRAAVEILLSRQLTEFEISLCQILKTQGLLPESIARKIVTIQLQDAQRAVNHHTARLAGFIRDLESLA